MKRILLINEGYSDNLGDQAIKKSMENLILSNYPEAKVDFLHYSNPNLKTPKTITDIKKKNKLFKFFKFFGFIFILKNYFNLLLKYSHINNYCIENNLKDKYDLVIIGGGQLINSSYRISPNPFSIIFFTWIKYFSDNNIKLVIFGIGVVDKYNWIEEKLYRKALNKVKYIYVRDNNSKNILDRIFNKESIKISDVVFNEYNNVYNESKNALIGIFSYHEYIVKFNRKNISIEDYYNVWYEKINEKIIEGYQIILIYTTSTDYHETINFSNYIKSRYDISFDIPINLTIDELNFIYKKSNYVFSGRMHALIFGLNNNLVVESFDVSNKVIEFKNEYIKNLIDFNVVKELLNSKIKEIIFK